MAATFRSMDDTLASSIDTAFGLNLLEAPCRDGVGSSTDGVSHSRLMASLDSTLRPFDFWKAAGEADPVEFERPQIGRGCRVKVLCFIPETQQYEVLSNVLVDKCQSAEVAYFPIPFTKAKKTIMGYVKVCAVLKRRHPDNALAEADDVYSLDNSVESRVFELTDEKVAVKINLVKKMEKLKDNHAEDPLKEIAAMQLIDEAPHVLGCSAVLYDDSAEVLNVVMKYCPHGDLFQVLEKAHLSSPNQIRGLSEPQARYWFKQVLEGIQSIHSRGVFHRDLSPENILMDHNQCFIIDFGMALRVPYKEPLTRNITGKTSDSRKCLFLPQGVAGKLPYMAPEIYENKDSFDGELVDVWSAGVILFCILTGCASYNRPQSSDPVYFCMTNGLKDLLDQWKVDVSEDAIDLLQKMIEPEPRLRSTLDEALGHPWFDGSVEEMDLSDSPLLF